MQSIEIYVIIFLCLCVTNLSGFIPVIVNLWGIGDPKIDFGYSVKLTKQTVYVGAPKYNNGEGAVFACSFRTCKKIIFEKKSSSDYTSVISEQLLGLNLDTYGTTLIACAPKWINNKYPNRYFLNGLCYVHNFATNNTELLIPFLSNLRQGYGGKFFYYAYGEAGFSLHINDKGSLTMGAPGLLQWLGSFATYNLSSDDTIFTPFVPNPINFYGDILEPGFSNSRLEAEYFGYAVSAGKFNGGTVMYVAGAPRSNNLTGQVFIYKEMQPESISIWHRFTGREIGEYFGSVLAVGDVTGDGNDDVIVGAPMYSGRTMESGCIYLFVYDGQGFYQQIIEAPQITSGHKRGRYGSAISIIGDIDQDGFNDVAIGAPYEEPCGVVYIHLGSKNGLLEQPYYKINGYVLQSGFGISISSALHNPNTGVTDIVVGAHRSGNVYMIHFRPIIRVVASLTTSDSKLNIENVSSHNFEFTITACIKYSAKYLSNKTFVFNTTLITDPYFGRIILQNPKNVISCSNNYFCCNNYTIRLVENFESIRHFYDEPLEFRFDYKLWGNNNEKMIPEFPEIAFNNPTTDYLYIPFEKACGDDELCQPKLKLVPKWLLNKNEFIIGTHQHVDVEATVYNFGENAYSCVLQVKHNIPLLRLPERCVQVNEGFLHCNIGNPLKHNAKRVLILQFDPALLDERQSTMNIEFNVTSIGSELEDIVQHLNLTIEREFNININSVSHPDQYPFNNTDENTTEIIQQYDIQNQGPSVLHLFIFILSIPKIGTNETAKIDIAGNEIVNGEMKSTYCDCNLVEAYDRYYKMLNSFCKINTSFTSDWASYNPSHYKCQSVKDQCEQYFCACSGKNVKHISVRITMLVDLNTLQNYMDDKDILVFTTNVMPLIKQNVQTNCHDAVTVFIGEIKIVNVFPWIIIGTVSGILILSIMIIALWQVGFFKRMILPTAEEKEGIVDDPNIDDFSVEVRYI